MDPTQAEQVKDEETGGFTLIELMVVVLLIGLLMAIAVPTFLSLTTSARAGGIESNLQIATMDEKIYFAQYSTYGGTAASGNNPAISSVDTGVTWMPYPNGGISETTTTKDVYIDSVTPADGTAGLVLGAASSVGSRYWVYLDEADGILEYAITQSQTAPALSSFTAASWSAAG